MKSYKQCDDCKTPYPTRDLSVWFGSITDYWLCDSCFDKRKKKEEEDLQQSILNNSI